MVKDAHLLEVAIVTDHVVISRDEEVRRLFRSASSGYAAIQRVLWGNPEMEDEEVVTWLRAGAKAESRRALGTKI